MLSSIRAAACFLVCGATVFAACGGKTTTDLGDGGPTADAAPAIPPPSSSVDASPDEPFDAGDRTCTQTCAQPHQCCAVNCGGQPKATPTACCTCLPDEVSSATCPGNKCGA